MSLSNQKKDVVLANTFTLLAIFAINCYHSAMKVLYLRVSDDLFNQVDRISLAERRSHTQMGSILIEEGLKKWPTTEKDQVITAVTSVSPTKPKVTVKKPPNQSIAPIKPSPKNARKLVTTPEVCKHGYPKGNRMCKYGCD